MRIRSGPLATRIAFTRSTAWALSNRGDHREGRRARRIVGGGAFGHSFGESLGFVFVTPEYEAPGSTFEIQMLGVRRRATVLAEPAYDSSNEAICA